MLRKSEIRGVGTSGVSNSIAFKKCRVYISLEDTIGYRNKYWVQQSTFSVREKWSKTKCITFSRRVRDSYHVEPTLFGTSEWKSTVGVDGTFISKGSLSELSCFLCTATSFLHT